jgi:hypothetical protein
MMFRKKKSAAREDRQPAMRGRATVGQGAGIDRKGSDNPLARRFQAGSEPATVDLAASPRFPEAVENLADPKTAALQTETVKLGRVISLDPATGKYYVHPADGETPVTLQGEPVRAPTELRSGDTIRIGHLEIRFGAGGRD